ncbi:YbhB/YbcL family Raf kinase inhibitor-like protein, partial [Tepidibacter sp. Z1-5]|uniref:YbhB/YbcL family Raf kinase inhibitor-like protein n=1 Tax=Tepidibacter sp. Z1-5 TaxID=3134138 RepID=UPI0030BB30B7
KEYMATKVVGDVELTVEFDKGNTARYIIEVKDTTPQELKVTSSAFDDGQTIPDKYCLNGSQPNGYTILNAQNISIPLTWTGHVENVKSYVIVMHDEHDWADNWVHWAVVDIPEDITSIQEGVSNIGIELKNSFGAGGYGGPKPPQGSGSHEYAITVYALDVDSIDISYDENSYIYYQNIMRAMQGHVLKEATIKGKYEK